MTNYVKYKEDTKIAEYAYLALENALVIDQLKHAVIDHRIDGVSMKDAIKLAKKFVDITEED